MNILILHNRYKQRGGEDAVVEAEVALLRSAGHNVRLVLISNDEITGTKQKISAFIRSSFDADQGERIRQILLAEKFDVVHIHNYFPKLTIAVHKAARVAGVAVVQTLHNYRLLCANATFLRKGKVCEKCLQSSPAWSVVHRCYRDSAIGSLAVVRMQAHALAEGGLETNVHRFIALTNFSRTKFVEGGLPSARIAVKPNFVADSFRTPRPRSGALFVGRLSPEKGLETLLEAWRAINAPLAIIGDGPEREKLAALAPNNVFFHGQQPTERVLCLMQQSSALIMPSIWYEGFPVTVVEAFSSALPVIASNIGSLGEIISDGVNGLHFRPGDPKSLASTARAALKNLPLLEKMSRGARQTYQAMYTPQKNLEQLEAIYVEAIQEANLARSSEARFR